MKMAGKPLGLRLLVWLFGFWAGAIALVLIGLSLGDAPIMMDGEAVPRAEALSRIAPILIPVGAAVVGAGLGLWLGRRWARPAALLPFLLLGIAPSLAGGSDRTPLDLIIAAAVVVPIVAVLTWYLYLSPTVSEWYATRTRLPRSEPRS
jgi:hypothetical protein